MMISPMAFWAKNTERSFQIRLTVLTPVSFVMKTARFHMIYEDWSPINARENGWDSPLAGRVSSPDGIRGFKYGEHPPAVDHRTRPTGKTGTFTHPAHEDFEQWQAARI